MATLLGTTDDELAALLDRATTADVSSLARAVLLEYSNVDDETVKRALASTGRKAFVLETATIGLVALMLLHTLKTGGKKSETRSSTRRIDAEGRLEITTSETVEYHSLGTLAAPVRALLNQPTEPPQ